MTKSLRIQLSTTLVLLLYLITPLALHYENRMKSFAILKITKRKKRGPTDDRNHRLGGWLRV